jgi:predicted phosphoadenosine phosphosulfate sulfurtransferase
VAEGATVSKAKERSQRKISIGIDVLTAARERIAWTFDTFSRICLSGPSGKDSGVMMHLVCQEARKRGRKIGVLYVDLEAQYRVTIEYVREMFALYADVIEPFWVQLPLRLRNAVSMEQPYWLCWDPSQREAWVRERSADAITDPSTFPFFKWPAEGSDCRREAMEFEEFIEQFGRWYAQGLACATFVGIRTDESLNRWRALAGDHNRCENKHWTTWKGDTVYNIYPIFDWSVEDIWTYVARENLPYNTLYDRMFEAGLSVHEMRICQPYGDDQRRGLNLFHVIEPETWTKVVTRVAGANYGALYAGKRGNILGNVRVTKPAEHTWQSYVEFLLTTLPDIEADHYRDKIAVFIHWWKEKRGVEIVDEADAKLESARDVPSWRRIAKVILKNDRLCKGIGFSQMRSSENSYEKRKKIMKKRRAQWRIYG